MMKNNKIIVIFLMALMLTPLFSVSIVEASEVNVKNQRAYQEYTELAITPTKVWVVRSGLSANKFMFYKEGKYRGWLTRDNDSPTAGSYTNFSGYIYRQDLPYPQPSKIEPYSIRQVD